MGIGFIENTELIEFIDGDAAGGGAPLDLVPGAFLALGQRALSSAMLGSPIYTIRRHSDDTEQSFSSDVITGDAPSSIEAFIGVPFTKDAVMFDGKIRILLDNSAGVQVGQPVTGTDIPEGSTVIQIMGLTSPFNQTGELTIDSDEVTLVDATGVVAEQYVTGIGIPDGTRVSNISDAPLIYLSELATESNPAATLTFHPTIKILTPPSTDASETLTFTPTGSVSTWNDQSGDANDVLQETALRQPFFAPDAIGGRHALRWPHPAPTDPNFVFLRTAGDVTFGVPCTFFIVSKALFDGGPDQPGYFSNFNPTISESYTRLGLNTLPGQGFSYTEVGFLLDAYSDPDEAGRYSAPTEIGTGFRVVDGAWTIGQWDLRLDGLSIAQGTSFDSGGVPAAVTQPLAIGVFDLNSGVYNQFFYGMMCEMIIYQSILSEPNRALIRQNIADYYGITLA